VNERTEYACRACAEADLRRESWYSAGFGWWSVQGLFATPYVLYTNLKQLNSFDKGDAILRLLAIQQLRNGAE